MQRTKIELKPKVPVGNEKVCYGKFTELLSRSLEFSILFRKGVEMILPSF